jgi:hypothetical protein
MPSLDKPRSVTGLIAMQERKGVVAAAFNDQR